MQKSETTNSVGNSKGDRAWDVARDEIQIQRDYYGSILSAGDVTNAALDAIICTTYTSHLPGEMSKNWKADKRRYQK